MFRKLPLELYSQPRYLTDLDLDLVLLLRAAGEMGEAREQGVMTERHVVIPGDERGPNPHTQPEGQAGVSPIF